MGDSLSLELAATSSKPHGLGRGQLASGLGSSFAELV
jgi:hypothetical protein